MHPEENRIELNDGSDLDYDYLIIATGPDLAFDEIPGLGPDRQHAVDLPDRPRGAGAARLRRAGEEARPGGDRRGAGRLLLRPGLRVRLHRRHGAAAQEEARPGADDLRHGRALYRPSRPRRRRRHQGPARKRHARAAHQVDHQRQGDQGRAGQDVRRGGERGRLGEGDARAALRLLHDAAGLQGRAGGARDRGADQSARLHHHRQVSAQPGLPERLRRSASASPSRRSARRRCRSACRRPAS